MIIDEDDYLAHSGTPRHSGRYPWGSGGDENARNKDFLGTVEGLRKQGLSNLEIAKSLDMTTTQLISYKSIAKNAQKQADINMAQRLREKGYGHSEIARRMSVGGRRVNESTVRSWLVPGAQTKSNILKSTSDMLRDQVDKKGYVDVGSGVEHHLGISKDKLRTAVTLLKDEGYEVHTVQVDQLGTRNKTNVKVLAPPGTTYMDIKLNKDKIQQIMDVSSNDGGRSFLGIQPPISVSSKRVAIKYAEQGGKDADGVIYVRPGVNDTTLGKSNYAQVRVTVDGTHYLKGMAMYKDDLPDGVDLMFNTNKKDTGTKTDAMKPLKTDKAGNLDEDNPYGAIIKKQLPKLDMHGREIENTVRSAMNIVNEEGDWGKWSKSLSPQMLSKQSPKLAKTQLEETYQRKKAEFDEISALTNPVVKRHLLTKFSDSADSSAVHLKAAPLPNQASHVILPIDSMKDAEIYAPNHDNGDRVVLIRFPHGGKFEIPELTVNNRQPEAKRLLGNAKDAVGISSKVAERLSGADFDGDTVLVIPNNNQKVKSSPALKDLQGFDPQSAYPYYEGMRRMTPEQKGQAMGDISNLITDMTIKGATDVELAKAVRHSMVVIDAEKHGLDYKQSAIDNGIKALKTRYQNGPNAGGSTLISQAKGRTDIRKRTNSVKIDKATGKKIFTETGRSWVNAKGKTIFDTQQSTKLAETEDAHTLSSGTDIEKIYADHSNRMKTLANEGRKAMVNTKTKPYSESAAKAYAKEVASLTNSLRLAQRNAPLERQAQVVGNAIVALKKQANPDMDKAELKKLKFLALEEARKRTGADKPKIEISDTEWDAIQAGAITTQKLKDILDNTDLDRIKELATPRSAVFMTKSNLQRAKSMEASGATQAEIARALGVSVSTLSKSLSGGEEQ